mmetsp:Transcript_6481/g.12984  ORF Transcript_6481/g.12984 Transcript_6481/m.12984 type:complete len:90 (+) Transcript_6481:135-404(+)
MKACGENKFPWRTSKLPVSGTETHKENLVSFYFIPGSERGEKVSEREKTQVGRESPKPLWPASPQFLPRLLRNCSRQISHYVSDLGITT